jgi:N-acetylmuramoyl-L-alanine amidase
MPRQTALADALRATGVAVREEPGWESRGGDTFNPRGVVCHHTGPGTVDGLLRLCVQGRSDLPGPLANVVLDPSGVAHVIAAGRANHAGRGGWRHLQGNSSVFGIEAVHPGNASPWPAAQIESYQRICKGMLRLVGSPADLVCGHKEWAPGRKIDPASLDMNSFRRAVAALLDTSNGHHQQEVLRPMYDPPIGPIAAVWQDGDSKVLAAVSPSGAVYAWGVPYVGGANGKSYFAGQTAAAIGPRDDGQAGYMITATSGEIYRYP